MSEELKDGSNVNAPVVTDIPPAVTAEQTADTVPDQVVAVFKDFADAIQAKPEIPTVEANVADGNHDITGPDKKPDKPEKDEMVKIQQKAIIEWLDDSGNVISSETHWRGAIPLFMHLSDKAREDKESLKRNVRIVLKSADPEDKQVFVIGEGTLLDVLEKLNNRIIFAPNAMSQLQIIVSQIAELSDLKAIMITAVFGPETPQVAGFGFTSESTDVTADDIKALASAVTGQIDMFKNKMRKKHNMTFDDDSRIITLGR